MYSYDTLTAALKDLDQRGYSIDFNLTAEGIESKVLNLHLRASEFEIDEFYRFEGMTDPADSSVVYAISSKDGKLKGVLIDAYGVYSDNISPELVNKLKKHN